MSAPSPFEILYTSTAFQDLLRDFNRERDATLAEHVAAVQSARSLDAATASIFAAGAVSGIDRIFSIINRRLKKSARPVES